MPELLSPRLFGFGDAQIIPSRVLPIGAGLLLRGRSTGVQVIDNLFGFLPGVIQEIEVRGIFNICGYAGGIDEELAFRKNGLAFPLLFDRFLCVWLGV